MMAQRNTGIDIFKVLMALVVVMIHTSGADPAVFKVAVPYFFLASGYFFFRDWEAGGTEAIAKGRRWLMRIAVMYLAWTLIYLPFTVLGFLQDGLGPGKSLAVFIRNLLFVGENYLSWPLWYLLASLWAGAVFIVLHRWRVPLWLVALVSGGMYGLAFLTGLDRMHWHRLIFKSGDYRILMALCFMSTGGLLGTFLDRIPRHGKRVGAGAVSVVSIVFVRWL